MALIIKQRETLVPLKNRTTPDKKVLRQTKEPEQEHSLTNLTATGNFNISELKRYGIEERLKLHQNGTLILRF